MMTTDTISAQSPPKATRKEWVGLVVLSIACMLYSMDLSVLFLAMPAITAELQPSPTQLLWINDIYGFMVAGFLVTMGTLGDLKGRRKVLLWGAAAFGLASIFCAFAQSAGMLITGRALLGIAGATIAPSTMSLIFNMFQREDERNRAIGVWGTAFAVGGTVGTSDWRRVAELVSLGIRVPDQCADHGRFAGAGARAFCRNTRLISPTHGST